MTANAEKDRCGVCLFMFFRLTALTACIRWIVFENIHDRSDTAEVELCKVHEWDKQNLEHLASSLSTKLWSPVCNGDMYCGLRSETTFYIREKACCVFAISWVHSCRFYFSWCHAARRRHPSFPMAEGFGTWPELWPMGTRVGENRRIQSQSGLDCSRDRDERGQITTCMKPSTRCRKVTTSTSKPPKLRNQAKIVGRRRCR